MAPINNLRKSHHSEWKRQWLFYFYCAFFSVLVGPCWGIGDVHTSAASVAQLVEVEETVVMTLKDYIAKEEARLNTIKQYIGSWGGEKTDYITNPINSYHFLRRLAHEFDPVKNALFDTITSAVRENITLLRDGMNPPGDADVNGAAYALVRLQDTYELAVDDLVEGDIKGDKAVQELSADDCIRLGEQSFNNLEFELSSQWYSKGIELLRSSQPLTEDVLRRIDRIQQQESHRSMMQSLLTNMIKSSDSVLDQFSGLGIPASFLKQVYAEKEEESCQLGKVDDYYRRLCRGEQIQPPEALIGLKCGYVFGNSGYYRLMPFRAELVWPDPIIVVYHDVLSESETDLLKEITRPRLETTMVHSFTTHEVRKSLARIGKTAWVTRGDDRRIDNILTRIEDMTGLTTETAEDMHVLNYGIGGHYDNHVDFFDLHNKSLDLEPHKGDRLSTMLFYLNDVKAGGSTVFPTLGLEVPARRGSALFWFNLKRNGEGDYRTVHASCPVLLGEKWIANLWIHEFGQEFKWKCTLDPEE